MDYLTLKKLVRQGENQHLEFKLKAKFPVRIVREAVAFANTEGGTLLIGVDDEKNIKGLKFASEEEYALNEAFQKYCSPPIDYHIERVVLESEREVLIYTIPKSEKIHRVLENLEDSNPGIAYVRVKDMSVKASREMREILKGRKRNRSVRFNYGIKEGLLMKYLEGHTQITVEEFATMAKISRKEASRTLVILVLAGVLEIQPQPHHADAFVMIEQLH